MDESSRLERFSPEIVDNKYFFFFLSLMDCENSPNNNPLPRFCQKGRERHSHGVRWIVAPQVCELGSEQRETGANPKRRSVEPRTPSERAQKFFNRHIPAQKQNIFFCFFPRFYIYIYIFTVFLFFRIRQFIYF